MRLRLPWGVAVHLAFRTLLKLNRWFFTLARFRSFHIIFSSLFGPAFGLGTSVLFRFHFLLLSFIYPSHPRSHAPFLRSSILLSLYFLLLFVLSSRSVPSSLRSPNLSPSIRPAASACLRGRRSACGLSHSSSSNPRCASCSIPFPRDGPGTGPTHYGVKGFISRFSAPSRKPEASFSEPESGRN